MLKNFTKETLAQYDGIHSPQKYIAVDGIVYDVTDNSHWINNHHGYIPGRDYSEEIKSAPHRKKVLDSLKIVGNYIS